MFDIIPEEMKTTAELLELLERAKRNTQSCLDKDGVLCDMHDLVYWAGEVVRLRKVIKERL